MYIRDDRFKSDGPPPWQTLVAINIDRAESTKNRHASITWLAPGPVIVRTGFNIIVFYRKIN